MCQHHGHGNLVFQRMLIKDKWKHVYNNEDVHELYDLVNDPFELKNLDGKDGFEKIEGELKKNLFSEMEQYKDLENRISCT